MQIVFRLKPALAGILVAFLVMPALSMAANADSGTGAFEGYTMTKLDSMDSIHLSLTGNVNATRPFIDTIDWYGKNDTESFFIFRYCPDPQNCVIGSATPDGKAIAKAFDRQATLPRFQEPRYPPKGTRSSSSPPMPRTRRRRKTSTSLSGAPRRSSGLQTTRS